MSQKLRRQYYIKKEFQRNFILNFCLLVVLACVLFGTLIYLLSSSSVTTTFEHSRLVLKHTSDYILPILGIACCVIVACISLATLFVVMRLSHQIAGPIFRFERHLKDVGTGNLAESVSLRSTDELQDFARGLNDMTSGLAAGIRTAQAQAAQLEALCAGAGPEVRQAVATLNETLGQFKTR